MEDNRQKLILETLKQSETLLGAQLQTALASDARAVSFCGLLIAAAALSTGLADGSQFSLAMYVAGTILFLAAGFAGWAAMPTKWYSPGQKGQDFAEDLSGDRPFLEVVKEMVLQNDKYISKNEAMQVNNAKVLKVSGWLAILAAPSGMLVEFSSRQLVLMLTCT